MSAAVLYMSMSLDGFIADPNEDPTRLHEWLLEGESRGAAGVPGHGHGPPRSAARRTPSMTKRPSPSSTTSSKSSPRGTGNRSISDQSADTPPTRRTVRFAAPVTTGRYGRPPVPQSSC